MGGRTGGPTLPMGCVGCRWIGGVLNGTRGRCGVGAGVGDCCKVCKTLAAGDSRVYGCAFAGVVMAPMACVWRGGG
eukprot:2496386-Lingulodinium_polyedra.AAC.1